MSLQYPTFVGGLPQLPKQPQRTKPTLFSQQEVHNEPEKQMTSSNTACVSHEPFLSENDEVRLTNILRNAQATPYRLHLGCFHKKIYGFINVDIRPDVAPDIVDDVFKLETIENNSVDMIYTCHVLEHAKRQEAKDALRRWHEVLKPGGILRVSVPDLEAVFAAYFYYQDLRLLENFLYGSQKHPYDFHYTGWDFRTMKEDMEEAGFKDVQRYDWRTTPPHSYTDDYSQAYLPHMDKEHGKLMSLNVEATKGVK